MNKEKREEIELKDKILQDRYEKEDSENLENVRIFKQYIDNLKTDLTLHDRGSEPLKDLLTDALDNNNIIRLFKSQKMIRQSFDQFSKVLIDYKEELLSIKSRSEKDIEKWENDIKK